MKFKRGVKRAVKPETAYWMGRIEAKFLYWFGTVPTCTSAYREGSGAHGRREAWDLSRTGEPVSDEEEFCRSIQLQFGSHLGVVLEPEWGQGPQFTAPHFHFQIKKPARWSQGDLERASRYVVELMVELRKEEMSPSVREELEAMGDLLEKALGG